MRFPLLGKLGALGAVVLALILGLNSISGIVSERQARQFEAEQSVVDGLAGAQTVLGPLLQRQCSEAWQRSEMDGRERRLVAERRDFVLTAWPRTLNVGSSAGIEPRYRGLFKLNSYLLKASISADWQDLSALQPVAQHAGSVLQCEAPNLVVALSDARGIRSAEIRAGVQKLAIIPGSGLKAEGRGFHAVLAERDEAAAGEPLHVEITLNLAGTRSLAWVPIGDESRIQLASDWPHPSFNGRFLPVVKAVSKTGFQAQWQVSALATTAQQTALGGARLCDVPGEPAATVDAACLDSFGVGFIDPVNGYVLNDRALKYGLLFVMLTFIGVGLVELMRQVRVHPAQYLLVGSALLVFFLLLLSLSEHTGFRWAYLGASAACSGLLTFYAAHILHGLRPGLLFGAAIALLYAALYALLQLEQTALVLGSMLLFAVLSGIMVVTRRLDWYALAARVRDDAARRTPDGVAGKLQPRPAGQ